MQKFLLPVIRDIRGSIPLVVAVCRAKPGRVRCADRSSLGPHSGPYVAGDQTLSKQTAESPKGTEAEQS